MHHLSETEIINLAYSLGIDAASIEIEKLLQFAKEIQAHALNNFATFVRENGIKDEVITWGDVATNAEIEAFNIGAYTL